MDKRSFIYGLITGVLAVIVVVIAMYWGNHEESSINISTLPYLS
jgi:hypothetical protein